jgi:hypothetical protein
MIPHAERLENAVTSMLEELQAEQEREGELSCALVETRHRRGELLRSLTILIKTFPRAERQRHDRRLARVDASYQAPRRRHGTTDRSRAVLAFLASYPGEEFRVAELDRALAAGGLDTRRAYSAQALHRIGKQGVVVRVGQGRYRVTRQHPDLVALRRKLLEEGGHEG